MICRLCKTDQPLIKAHIIPEGFFRSLDDGSGRLMIHTNEPGGRPRKSPIGEYDTSILCGPCDNIFSPWEQHAQDVLLQDLPDTAAVYRGATKVAWRIESFDYRLLKLFFLSLLWRASVSTRRFCRRVSTGPFEGVLHRMIRARDPGTPEEFAVILGRFDEPGYNAMLDPHPDRDDGIKYVRFYLAGVVAYIKVDSRPPTEPFAGLILRPDAPLRMIRRDARDSKDGALLRALAQAADEYSARRGAPR
jgi:hypothetical protein